MEKFIPLKEDENLSVILDTDIGGDCDDAGAINLLAYYCKKYKNRLLGVVNDTSNPYGSGAIDGILTYFGIDVPVGQYEKDGFLDEHDLGNVKYNKFVTENFAKKDKQIYPATELYKMLLEKSEDNSVVIIGIGFLNTINNAFCELKELFLKKVRYVVSMAGDFTPDGEPEWNVKIDIKSAKNFFENFPKPIIFCGFEVGKDVMTGFSEKDMSNPVNASYWLFNLGKTGIRNSWDLCTVTFAFEGEGDVYKLSEEIFLTVADDGKFIFKPQQGTGKCYIKLISSAEKAEEDINRILNGKVTK